MFPALDDLASIEVDMNHPLDAEKNAAEALTIDPHQRLQPVRDGPGEVPAGPV